MTFNWYEPTIVLMAGNTIEDMQSQQFSNAMFIFLMGCIFFFTVIVVYVLFSRNAYKNMRIGEKIMFAAIFLGIVAAIFLAVNQMIFNRLI